MFRTLTVVVAFVGCNQVLGLDEPDRVDTITDTDGDGVADSRDNCPQVPNADQADADHDRRGDACDSCPLATPTRDRDGDGIDDACDSCILGPQVDDDGDGVMDACDLCPVTATEQQADFDGDLIGDECDAPVGLSNDSTRVLFDGLTSIGPNWDNGAAWVVGADGSSITPAGPQTAELREHTASEHGNTSVSVMVELPADGQIVLALADPTEFCSVSCTAGACLLHLEDGEVDERGPFPFHRGTIRATYQPPSFQVGGWACELYVNGKLINSVSVSLMTFGVGGLVLRATPGTKVFGVDIVH